jgi:esterase/lipase superfamily enzyme
MNAYLLEKCLMMGFAVVVACSVGSYATNSIHNFTDVLAKVTQVQR